MAQEGEGERGLAPMRPQPVCTGCRRAAMSAGQRFANSPPFRFQSSSTGKIWGVAGQLFDLQPGPLRGEVGPHPATLVRAQTIPDEHDPLAAKVSFQSAQEADCWSGARVGLKVQAGPPAIPPKRQGGGDRQPFPVRPGVLQDGGLPARRPLPPRAAATHFRPRRLSRRAGAARFLYLPRALATPPPPPPPSPPAALATIHDNVIARPVRRAMTVAIRGNVHRVVAKPWAAGPFSSAASTRPTAGR